MADNQSNLTKILLAVFLGLFIVAVLVKNNPFAKPSANEPLLNNITKENVSKLVFHTDDGKIFIEKESDDWILKEAENEATPASTQSIDSFFNLVTSINKEDVVSINTDKHKEFAVDEENAKHIELWQGNNITTLLVGKKTVDYQKEYVRIQNDDFVYKSSGPLSSYFTLTTWQ